MRKSLLLACIGLAVSLSADEGRVEDGALQFTVNPEETQSKEAGKMKKSEPVRLAVGKITDMTSDGMGTFEFNVSDDCRGLMQIEDADGKPVATLFSDILLKGRHRIIWKMTDASGTKTKPGKYSITFRQGFSVEKDASFGQGGSVAFKAPVNVQCAPDGKIYVSDESNIISFDPDGKSQQVFKERMSLLHVDRTGRVYGFDRGWVNVFDAKGEKLGTLAGAAPSMGFSTGPDGVYYSREGIGHTLKTGSGEPCKFVKTDANLKLGPVHGKYAFPSMAADDKGNIYATDCFSNGAYRGGVAKYLYDGKTVRYMYHCLAPLKDVIGIDRTSGDVIYGVERGTVTEMNKSEKFAPDKIARLVQICDSGNGLQLVERIELPDVKGARTVAVSPDGKAVYVLEDAVDFWPGGELSLQGKGRLFKYVFKYASAQKIPVTLKNRE